MLLHEIAVPPITQSILTYVRQNIRTPTLDDDITKFMHQHPQFVYSGHVYRGLIVHIDTSVPPTDIDSLMPSVSDRGKYTSYTKTLDNAYAHLRGHMIFDRFGHSIVISAFGSGLDVEAAFPQVKGQQEVLCASVEDVHIIGTLFGNQWFPRERFDKFIQKCIRGASAKEQDYTHIDMEYLNSLTMKR